MPTGMAEPPAARIVLRQHDNDVTQPINGSEDNLRFKDRTFPGRDHKTIEMLRRNESRISRARPKSVTPWTPTTSLCRTWWGCPDKKTWREFTGPTTMGIEPVDVKSQTMSNKEVAGFRSSLDPVHSTRDSRTHVFGRTVHAKPARNHVRFDPVERRPWRHVERAGGRPAFGCFRRRLIHPMSEERIDLGARAQLDGRPSTGA